MRNEASPVNACPSTGDCLLFAREVSKPFQKLSPTHPLNDLLNLIKLHLSTNARCARPDQGGIAFVMGGDCHHADLVTRRPDFFDQRIAFPVIEIKVNQHQIERLYSSRFLRPGYARHNGDLMLRKK